MSIPITELSGHGVGLDNTFLIGEIQAQPGVRLPGLHRDAALEKTQQQGIEISDALLKQIQALAIPLKTA